jgi:dynein heavy chain
LIATVSKETIQADKEKAICEKDEAECSIIRNEALKLQSECEVQLIEVEKILNIAAAAVKNIQRNSIDELKGTKAPSEAVASLFKCLCIIYDEKPCTC